MSRTTANHFAWIKRRCQKPSGGMLSNEKARKGQNKIKINNLYLPTAVFIAKMSVEQSNDRENRRLSLEFAVFYCFRGNCFMDFIVRVNPKIS